VLHNISVLCITQCHF